MAGHTHLETNQRQHHLLRLGVVALLPLVLGRGDELLDLGASAMGFISLHYLLAQERRDGVLVLKIDVVVGVRSLVLEDNLVELKGTDGLEEDFFNLELVALNREDTNVSAK